MKPLLVGQAPGPSTSPDHPLFPLPSTSAGGRLAQVMGLDAREYLRRFDRVNLLRHFPGRHKRDDKFPAREARIAAQAVLPLLGERTVILVGRNVAQAFGLGAALLGFHEWLLLRPLNICLACVPHTSGRNRWYNETANLDVARTFWERFLREGPDTEKKCLPFAALWRENRATDRQ